jgi:beta-galactosidase/beta-glucuronidase
MNCRTILCGAALLAAILDPRSANAWQPADGPLKTRWTSQVSSEKAWPEYPRPQMVRERDASPRPGGPKEPVWTNLNGLWQYAIRPDAEGRPKKWDGEILVPFAVESALSGVKKSVRPNEQLWYRREFSVGSLPEGDIFRMLLHFGAVDWKCRVWVNGREVGHHSGGYDPFTFDITAALNSAKGKSFTGLHELVVAVSDPTDSSTQPRGKQILKPHGIWYTAVTGIWQTVWLESVPERHIESFQVVPDIDRKTATVTVQATGKSVIRVQAVDPRRTDTRLIVAEKEGKAGEPLELSLPHPDLWSPDHPALYGLDIALMDGNNRVDAVLGYFGMRKIEVKKDAEGINRLWLNNKVLFQFGPLDQGWWPDGLYTAPTDEALKYDIEMTKRLGMNMARKHVKVEPDRWYYWCDKLGLLVWQDMPSGDKFIRPNDPDIKRSAESAAQYEREWSAIIRSRWNHPSIVMWVPFNEGWGQFDTARIVEFTHKLDPSRLVDCASGWTDRGVGDVHDMHKYPGPGMPKVEEKRAAVLGEFGGLGMPTRGHTWQTEKNWGYVSYDTPKKLTDAYVAQLENLQPLIERGLSAAVYTQTTDVEGEVNGLMTYDREIVKMNEKRISAAAERLYVPRLEPSLQTR